MSDNRVALIEKVFSKLDRDGTGVVTMKDLDGIYNYLDHPQYISGEKTKHQIFKDFLNTFEKSGVVDGKVGHTGHPTMMYFTFSSVALLTSALLRIVDNAYSPRNCRPPRYSSSLVGSNAPHYFELNR